MRTRSIEARDCGRGIVRTPVLRSIGSARPNTPPRSSYAQSQSSRASPRGPPACGESGGRIVYLMRMLWSSRSTPVIVSEWPTGNDGSSQRSRSRARLPCSGLTAQSARARPAPRRQYPGQSRCWTRERSLAGRSPTPPVASRTPAAPSRPPVLDPQPSRRGATNPTPPGPVSFGSKPTPRHQASRLSLPWRNSGRRRLLFGAAPGTPPAVADRSFRHAVLVGRSASRLGAARRCCDTTASGVGSSWSALE